ncbi:MAG: pilus assembly protein PilM, partial [Candidatus Spechtbacterales bacterium]|nr:pilus assembly protein PilM [Candidatus Spechtbacterales bacterium]
MFSGIKNFFEVLPPAVGLDISDSSIKYAQLERKGRYFNLLAHGERDIPKGIVESGRIQNPKMLSEILEETLVKNKPSGLSSYVVASIPDEEIFLKVITLPNVPKKEIKNMILVEAER